MSVNTNSGIVADPNGIRLRLVEIPAGSFLMGASEAEIGSRDNERPVHRVDVPSFHLGIHPVTQRQWRKVMGKLPAIGSGPVNDELPVVNVWLEDALHFCDAFGKRSGFSIRLPSEAEWEYACRAGTITSFYWGESISKDHANFNSGESSSLEPVALRTPNAFGLFDMHGNVWEWCADSWHDDYTGAPSDGSAWTSGSDAGYQVQRGGSWIDPAPACRSAFRVGDIAHNNDSIVGLRVCATIRENG